MLKFGRKYLKEDKFMNSKTNRKNKKNQKFSNSLILWVVIN